MLFDFLNQSSYFFKTMHLKFKYLFTFLNQLKFMEEIDLFWNVFYSISMKRFYSIDIMSISLIFKNIHF